MHFHVRVSEINIKLCYVCKRDLTHCFGENDISRKKNMNERKSNETSDPLDGVVRFSVISKRRSWIDSI